MKTFDELILVNYCHPDCTPLLNIMRLPQDEAFELAQKLANAHPETTAFYRFADFHNYYVLRMDQDSFLYSRFIELGGKPEEIHPLSFVVEGSDYLCDWFGGGTETRILLKDISPCHISFTIGDSGAEFGKNGRVELFTVKQLQNMLEENDGIEEFLRKAGKHYIEAQLWSDKYLEFVSM